MTSNDFTHEHRFSRQVRFLPLGTAGQEKLAESHVVIVGCGALGSVTSTALARAGVGKLTIIDRDVPEWSNLPRQFFFTEADVKAGIPKAEVAARRLQEIDGRLNVIPRVVDLTARNAIDLLADATLLIDGTDNFETRFLINDFSCRENIPWVYGGVIGAEGRVMSVVPRHTACLRCLVPEPPPPGSLPTCDTAGVIGPAVMVVGGVQAVEAIKLITVAEPQPPSRLLVCDLWESNWRVIDLSPLAETGCPSCRDRDHPWLDCRRGSDPVVLCGQDAVQFPSLGTAPVDLKELTHRLRHLGEITENPWLVRAVVEPGINLSVFVDGRIIVNGTRKPDQARSIVARYLGS